MIIGVVRVILDVHNLGGKKCSEIIEWSAYTFSVPYVFLNRKSYKLLLLVYLTHVRSFRIAFLIQDCYTSINCYENEIPDFLWFLLLFIRHLTI